MRPFIIYGSIILFCLVISAVEADKKWKYDETSEGKNKRDTNEDTERNRKTRNSKTKSTKDIENDSSEETLQLGKSTKKKLVRQEAIEISDEEESAQKPIGDQQASKKFIGRIEHGKVKVLRRKEDKHDNNDDHVGEDDKEKVCRKSKGGKKVDCNGNGDDSDGDKENGSSSEENGQKKGKPKNKIKYSIKFQHEKQKKKENNNADISIIRLHKNGRNRYGKDDDNDSSEEDDHPKRFHMMDDDD